MTLFDLNRLPPPPKPPNDGCYWKKYDIYAQHTTTGSAIIMSWCIFFLLSFTSESLCSHLSVTDALHQHSWTQHRDLRHFTEQIHCTLVTKSQCRTTVQETHDNAFFPPIMSNSYSDEDLLKVKENRDTLNIIAHFCGVKALPWTAHKNKEP